MTTRKAGRNLTRPDSVKIDSLRHDRKTRRRGLVGEWVAATFLIVKGYRILERRYRTPHGEIDLIARRANTIAFVEVKARPTLELALLSITSRQRRRIIATAELWIAGQPEMSDIDLRFDVVAVMPRGVPAHLAGAFTTDDF